MRAFILNLLVLLLVLIQIGYKSPDYHASAAEAAIEPGSGCLVLSYHRVRPPNLLNKVLTAVGNSQELTTYSVYTDEFAAQMQALKKQGVRFITAAELQDQLQGKQHIEGKCALVTFDDIDRTVYENAFPILQKEHIGERQYRHLNLATLPQLQEMKRSGLAEIGVHTYDMPHPDDDNDPSVLRPENLSAFEQDTEKAETAFRKLFGDAPRYYSYPYGFGSAATDALLQRRGYGLIFSLQPGLNSHKGSTLVKRILVSRSSWSKIEEWAQR
ncbi:polysaccharide deacetylase family protein [Ectobacillus ponti]|uniref:Polysaccharide deacetylase family protein n=1 Tax=Ectobacillus ponti TaxID=2961894 RepID=A0AA41X351_9BACI|nr:polysaccharide deacetylase family protein [Ectobacillus ponti]MCP8968084.1 polysaccharide deacetylase family protein [Ectobacillus ponti]